jgi:hypothetical protein
MLIIIRTMKFLVNWRGVPGPDLLVTIKTPDYGLIAGDQRTSDGVSPSPPQSSQRIFIDTPGKPAYSLANLRWLCCSPL